MSFVNCYEKLSRMMINVYEGPVHKFLDYNRSTSHFSPILVLVPRPTLVGTRGLAPPKVGAHHRNKEPCL
jgi:hypothetical protein